MFRSLKVGAFTRYQHRPLIIRVLVTIEMPSSRFLNSLAMVPMSPRQKLNKITSLGSRG